MTLDVLVIGGGIGGLCLAQGLRSTGIRVRVFERDRDGDDRLDRYRLHISPAGSRALHACLPARSWETFVDSAGRSDGGFGFLDERLRRLVVVEDGIMYPPSTEAWERPYAVDRRTLRQVLLAGLDGVVQFDTRFTHYEQGSDGRVTAFFADGGSATGDILIGSDGAGSRVRRQYLPDAEPVDTGAVGVGLTLPLTARNRAWLPQRLLTGMNLIVAAAPCFLFTSPFERSRREDYLLCAFVARADAAPAELAEVDGAGLQRAIEGMVVGWHPDLRRLIAECPAESVGRYPFRAAPALTSWPASTVTLLGDAVHAMPPAGGIGANTALRDARLLSRQLARVERGELALEAAVAEYEEEMRDYGSAAVRSALQTLRLGLLSNPLAVGGMRAWFRLAGAAAPIRRRGFRETWAAAARPRSWERGPRLRAGTGASRSPSRPCG